MALQNGKPQSFTKNFLDTSVVVPLLFSTSLYRKYLEERIGANQYISAYVLMEFRRSYALTLINLYFELRNPEIMTVDEAMSLWSERYKPRQIKATLSLAGKIFEGSNLDWGRRADKNPALLQLGLYTKRLMRKFNKAFSRIKLDPTQCERAKIGFRANLPSLHEDLLRFAERFGDIRGCASRCKINKFLTEKHCDIQRLIDHAAGLQENKENSGFRKIVKELNVIMADDRKVFSCKRCETIGDAVIALSAPDEMLLHHTDHAFNDLCDAIGRQHLLHDSPVAVHRDARQSAS